jgi:hypothetical protein
MNSFVLQGSKSDYGTDCSAKSEKIYFSTLIYCTALKNQLQHFPPSFQNGNVDFFVRKRIINLTTEFITMSSGQGEIPDRR